MNALLYFVFKLRLRAASFHTPLDGARFHALWRALAYAYFLLFHIEKNARHVIIMAHRPCINASMTSQRATGNWLY